MNRGSPLGAIRDVYERRLREAEALRRQAQAAADRAYHDAVRAGQGVATQVRKDAERLGANVSRSLTPRKPPAPPPRRASVQPRAQGPAKSRGDVIVDQILAGLRGGQDAFTFGLGDLAYAGGNALVDVTHGEDLGEAWTRRVAAERARDQYDKQHYATARTVGEIGGTALGLVALGPIDGILAGGTRIAQTAAIGGREIGAIGAAGAGFGVGGQALSDRMSGRRGSVGDYLGAAAGGAVGALGSIRGRPTQAAALGGATTSIA